MVLLQRLGDSLGPAKAVLNNIPVELAHHIINILLAIVEVVVKVRVLVDVHHNNGIASHRD